MADEPPRIRVCGVPEHFNVPWRTLAEANPNIEWINAPGGTGAMMEGLRNGDFDIIIALTESLIAGIEKGGNNEKLLGCYVQSKLNWAVTVGADSAVTSYDDLKPAQKSTTFAISRHGSGSETMAFVMAGQLGWPKDPGINFQVCHTFDEMTRRVNLPQDDPEHCDAQMWEWFTSKPKVVAGECKYIESVISGTDAPILTPWPCFSIAATTKTCADPAKREYLNELFKELETHCEQFKANKDGASIARVMKDHGLNEEDARTWFYGGPGADPAGVQYATGYKAGKPTLSKAMLLKCRETLIDAGVLKPDPPGVQCDLDGLVDCALAP